MPSPSPRAPAAEKKAKTRVSEDLARLKDATSLEEDDKADGLAKVRELVKAVEGKAFVKRKDGVWVDKAWDGKAPTTKVEAWSEAYFKLMAKGDKVARYLALGEQLIVVIDGTTYEIVPAK